MTGCNVDEVRNIHDVISNDLNAILRRRVRSDRQ